MRSWLRTGNRQGAIGNGKMQQGIWSKRLSLLSCFRTIAHCLLPMTFLVAGCAFITPAPEEILKEASADQLIQLLEERAAAIRTLKGLFKVQVRGPGFPFAHRVQGAVFFQRPETLRLQGFTPFGGELFEFVLGESRYRLRIPSMGQDRAGTVAQLDRSGDLARPFRLSLFAMTGAIGIAPVTKGARVRLVEEGARYRLDVSPPGEVERAGEVWPARRLWFERRLLQVVQEERLTTTGEIDATIQCEDFRPVGRIVEEGEAEPDPASLRTDDTLVRPFKITAEDGRGQASLVLTFQEMIPNPTLTPMDLGSVADSEHGERRLLKVERRTIVVGAVP